MKNFHNSEGYLNMFDDQKKQDFFLNKSRYKQTTFYIC